jgi:glycosyltransferase involved in cell wall biosynthesis
LLQESGRISRDLRVEVYGGLHPDVNKAFHAELRRNSRITYHSFASDATIAAAYKRSLFSVLASVDEGFGLPITESLAHGVPCLTANFGAMREVAEGGGCRLIDVRDSAALAEGFAELANHPSLRASLRAEIAARKMRGWKDYARDLLAAFAVVTEKDGERESAAGIAASPRANGLFAFGEVARPPDAIIGDGLRAPLSVFRFHGAPSDAATLPRDVLNRMASADAWAVADSEVGAALIAAAAIADVPKMLPGTLISGPKQDLDTVIRARIGDLWRRDARAAAAAVRECAARILLRQHRAETAGLSEPLSIIVSTYNRGPFVEANTEWLLRITDLPGEAVQVIVVDNASTDDTVDRLERFRSHPRFTLRVNSQNVGMLGNLRVCATLARSRHVWLTGDDDFIVPEALRAIREVLLDDPGLPLISVNFAVYHRTQLSPQDRPELFLKEGRPLATDVLPSGVYPLNQIATQHDNLFTAIYPLVFRTDLLRACFNFPFSGVPFGDLTESVPTTRYLLEACRYFKCFWHAPVGVIGNAHNSWSRYRPRWHAVLMPQVFELAREAGADPVQLQRFASLHLTLYNESIVGIASDTGVVTQIAPCELRAAHRVFRTRPSLPEQHIP